MRINEEAVQQELDELMKVLNDPNADKELIQQKLKETKDALKAGGVTWKLSFIKLKISSLVFNKFNVHK